MEGMETRSKHDKELDNKLVLEKLLITLLQNMINREGSRALH